MLSKVILRPATRGDIPALHMLRLSVHENRLSDPSKVTHTDYEKRLQQSDAGWVAETDIGIIGFAIADYPSRSIWALFVKPGSEGHGVGRALLQRVTQTLAATGAGMIHLSTQAGTRAERLYVAAGWVEAGRLPNGEVHFVRTVQPAV